VSAANGGWQGGVLVLITAAVAAAAAAVKRLLRLLLGNANGASMWLPAAPKSVIMAGIPWCSQGMTAQGTRQF
jgi:hypothetical protein